MWRNCRSAGRNIPFLMPYHSVLCVVVCIVFPMVQERNLLIPLSPMIARDFLPLQPGWTALESWSGFGWELAAFMICGCVDKSILFPKSVCNIFYDRRRPAPAGLLFSCSGQRQPSCPPKKQRCKPPTACSVFISSCLFPWQSFQRSDWAVPSGPPDPDRQSRSWEALSD